jgi:hypothetical protein
MYGVWGVWLWIFWELARPWVVFLILYIYVLLACFGWTCSTLNKNRVYVLIFTRTSAKICPNQPRALKINFLRPFLCHLSILYSSREPPDLHLWRWNMAWRLLRSFLPYFHIFYFSTPAMSGRYQSRHKFTSFDLRSRIPADLTETNLVDGVRLDVSNQPHVCFWRSKCAFGYYFRPRSCAPLGKRAQKYATCFFCTFFCLCDPESEKMNR